MRESDLAAEIEYRMRRLGAEKPAFETIVAAGARSALPHASPTAARFARATLVVVDMGAMRDGYASDMTRMLFVGTPGRKVKRLYRAVLEAQLAAIDAGAGGRRGGRRGPRRAARAAGRKASAARSSTPPGTAWAWKSTSRRALGKREKPATPGGHGDHDRARRLPRRLRRHPHRGHRGGDRRRLRSAHADRQGTAGHLTGTGPTSCYPDGLKRTWQVPAALAALALAAFALVSGRTAGVQPDGSILIPTGQTITPAGVHIEVTDRPLGMVRSPDGDLLAVVTGSNFAPRSFT